MLPPGVSADDFRYILPEIVIADDGSLLVACVACSPAAGDQAPVPRGVSDRGRRVAPSPIVL